MDVRKGCVLWRCGWCGIFEVRVETFWQPKQRHYLRMAVCDSCGAIGRKRPPEQWQGVEHEARNLQYSRGY